MNQPSELPPDDRIPPMSPVRARVVILQLALGVFWTLGLMCMCLTSVLVFSRLSRTPVPQEHRIAAMIYLGVEGFLAVLSIALAWRIWLRGRIAPAIALALSAVEAIVFGGMAGWFAVQIAHRGALPMLVIGLGITGGIAGANVLLGYRLLRLWQEDRVRGDKL